MVGWIILGVAVILIIIIYGHSLLKGKDEKLQNCHMIIQTKNKMLTSLTDECEAKQKEIDQIKLEMADVKVELATIRDQLDDMSFAIQDRAGSLSSYPALDALRELGMAFPDAQCVKELEDALDNAAIYIKTHQAVSPCGNLSVSDGAEALVLASFDQMADQVIASASASSSYEKSRQDIYLAYHITNLRAEKALHVSITKKYLEAKLEILRWSLIVHEFRRIMREEEKNRREAERQDMRSMREMHRREQEAIKEQEMYERALQQAKTAMQNSLSYTEKKKLEARIKQLEAQIIAKGDEVRALTAAQQGRSGTVYIISNIGSFGENIYKIGMTRRLDPQERIDELNEASTPYPFDVHAFIKTPDAPKLEHDLHLFFSAQKVNLVAHSNAREFYHVSLEQIKQQVEKMGYSASWKIQADAVQYNQSEKMRMNGIMPMTMLQNPAEASDNKALVLESIDNSSTKDIYPSIDQLIRLLSEHNIPFVDKRDKGGCL